MWSLACILAELYTGYSLFPGENEAEQIACFMEINGVPPRALLDKSERGKKYFDSSGEPKLVANSKGEEEDAKLKGPRRAAGARPRLHRLSVEMPPLGRRRQDHPGRGVATPWIVGEEPAASTPSSLGHARPVSIVVALLGSNFSKVGGWRSRAGEVVEDAENSSATTSLEEVKLIGRRWSQ